MNIQALLTGYELEQMSRYLKLIQTSIDQQLDEIEEAYKKEITKDMSEHDYFFFEDHYTDRFIEAGLKFPQLLYSNFVVSWYSFVEQKLLDICTDLKLVISIKPKEYKNSGKGIRRARRFLIQAKNYEIHPPYWEELININRLRNFIVHEGNKVLGSYINSEEEMIQLQDDDGSSFFFSINKSLFNYMKSNNLFSHSGMFLEIMPTNDYCNYLIELGHNMFNRLYHDLYPRKT